MPKYYEQNANDDQVGGTHYKGKRVEHWDFVLNVLDGRYLEGCATKYLSRWRSKGGVIDLEKALHYVRKLHEEFLDGRYSPPSPASKFGKYSPALFCEDRGMDDEETAIFTRLCEWSNRRDLMWILAALVAYIENAKDELAQARGLAHAEGEALNAEFKEIDNGND